MALRGGNFSEADLAAIDISHRGGRGARCPIDQKPLVTTAWNGGTVKMVYFLCRACARIGAIGYDSDDPKVPGHIARPPSPSSRPPSSR
jgi:hypothetical protein